MTREAIAELESQLGEAKRVYLRSHGWEVTFKTPGSVPLWFRSFEGDRTIMVDIDCAVQMTMGAEQEPGVDSSE